MIVKGRVKGRLIPPDQRRDHTFTQKTKLPKIYNDRIMTGERSR